MSLRESLIEIIQKAEALKLPYLLVGGHAVIVYGVSRFTRDFDLLIPETKVEAWTHLLTTHFHYKLFQSTHAFLRFESSQPDYPATDFVVVDLSTWEKLDAKTESRPLTASINVRLPRPSHLIAMKLTALSAPHRRKDNQDWSDIINLIREQKLSLEDSELRSIVLRYGNEETLKKLQKDLS